MCQAPKCRWQRSIRRLGLTIPASPYRTRLGTDASGSAPEVHAQRRTSTAWHKQYGQGRALEQSMGSRRLDAECAFVGALMASVGQHVT